MILLAPLGLLGLISLPVIYLIHLLRGTRRRHVVPATFLWADLPVAPSGYSRRRLPPITLLLLLQLLAAALASLALARPALSSAPARHLALVIDASASMQATDVTPTRFAAAIAAASSDVAQLAPTDRVSVIRAGPTPSLVGTGPPDAARSALTRARAGRDVEQPARRARAGFGRSEHDAERRRRDRGLHGCRRLAVDGHRDACRAGAVFDRGRRRRKPGDRQSAGADATGRRSPRGVRRDRQLRATTRSTFRSRRAATTRSSTSARSRSRRGRGSGSPFPFQPACAA